MLIPLDTDTPAFAVRRAGRDGVSLAMVCASSAEAEDLARALASDAAGAPCVVPVLVRVTEATESRQPGERL